MYCKDCEWWKDKYCQNETKLHENEYLNENENIDELDYSYNEGGSFQTGPMFGCVHFRAMANNEFNLT